MSESLIVGSGGSVEIGSGKYGSAETSIGYGSAETSIGYLSEGYRRTLIIGGEDIRIKKDDTMVISATQRKYVQDDDDPRGKMILRADGGVHIETEPDKFVNVSEELSKIDLLIEEMSEIKEMLRDIYFAPGGPGYLKAKSHFEKSEQ